MQSYRWIQFIFDIRCSYPVGIDLSLNLEVPKLDIVIDQVLKDSTKFQLLMLLYSFEEDETYLMPETVQN